MKLHSSKFLELIKLAPNPGETFTVFKKYSKLLLIFFVLFCMLPTNKIIAQFSNKHYIAPSPWSYFSKYNELVITTLSNTPVTVVIKSSDGTDYSSQNSFGTGNTTVAGTPLRYRFPQPHAPLGNAKNTVLNGAGLIISASQPIGVQIRNIASDFLTTVNTSTPGDHVVDFQKGNSAFTSFADQGRGTAFTNGYYRNIPNTNNNEDILYIVMATENGTSVFENGNLLVSLNEGQSYIYTSSIGAQITSNKPIIAGAGTRNDGPGGCGDGVQSQLIPNNLLGTSYVIVRSNSYSNTAQYLGDKSTIVATQANTSVTVQVTGGGSTNYTLNNIGDFVTIDNGDGVTQYSTAFVTSNKPISVFTGSVDGCEVDMIVQAPISGCSGSFDIQTNKFLNNINLGNVDFNYFGYAIIQSPTSKIFLNGTDLETLVPSRVAIGSSGFYLIRFDKNNIASPSNLRFTSSDRISVAMVQAGNGFSMSSFISSISDAMPPPTVSGSCSPVTLTAQAGFNSYKWFLNGSQISGASSQTYTTTQAGNYTVVGTSSTCGDSDPSTAVTINASSVSTTNVSICSNQLPYNWNGTNYNTAGTYTFTTTNSVGCDSIATLNLSVSTTTPTINGAGGSNLITNGSFENGFGSCSGTTSTGCTTNGACSFCFTNEAPSGWTWVKGNFDIYQQGITGSDFINGVPNGNYAIDLNGNAAGGIRQNVSALNIGSTYTLSFNAANNNASIGGSINCTAIKPLRVRVFDASNNVILNQLINTTTSARINGNWPAYTFSFVANTSNVSVQFESEFTDKANCGGSFTFFGPTLDNISLSGGTNSASICSGASYTLTSSSSTGNQWYKDGNIISGAANQTYSASQAGIYTVQVTNGGCSGTSNPFTITLNSNSSSTTNIGVCSNQLPYSWNGTNYNSAGTYTFTTTNSVGCDSIATLNLSISNCSNPVTESGTAPATGGTAIANVRSNDQVNGVAATAANSTISQSGVWPAGITLNTTTGAITVAPGTAPGVYPVTYQLCDLSANCATVVDTIKVNPSACNFNFQTGIFNTPLPGPSLPTTSTISGINVQTGVILVPSSYAQPGSNWITAGYQWGVSNAQFTPAVQNATSPYAILTRNPSTVPLADFGSYWTTKLDFTTGANKPQGLNFQITDMDNGDDSSTLLIYSGGSLVNYNYVKDGGASSYVRAFNNSGSLIPGNSGSGNYINFNGTSSNNSSPTANYSNGVVSISTNSSTAIDSIVLRRQLKPRFTNPTLGNGNASISIGNFCWNSQVSNSVTSGGGGGIESKTLGNVISQRLYGKSISNQSQDLPTPTQGFTKNTTAILNGPSDLKLSDLIPANVVGTDRALISTPTDLINFTNALEVLSVDYTKSTVNKAVAFATRTSGDVYSHTKPICDRLRGAELMEVKTMNINGYNVMAYQIRQRTGEVEYAMNLNAGVKVGRSSISVQSNWFTNSYVQDETMFNFQLWAVSYDMVGNMAKDIITKLQQQGAVSSVTPTDLPRAYVSKGNRAGTKVNLTVQNNTTSTTGYFEIKEKLNENAVETIRQVPFTAAANKVSQVQLPVQDFYEASIYMYLNNKLVDLVYMADGTWSLDYNKNTTSISKFNVQNELNPQEQTGEYRLMRNVSVQGTTKDYISVYKTINGGGVEQNLSAYKGIKFTTDAIGVGQLKVTIIRKGVQNWNDQYSYTINLDGTNKEYAIGLSQFKSNRFTTAINANDVLGVNFGYNNTRGGSTNATISLSKVRFTTVDVAAQTAMQSKMVSVYPNPVSAGQFTASFMSEEEQTVVLRVVEIATGKTVKAQFVQAKKGTNQVSVQLQNTTNNGMYSVQVQSDNGNYEAQKLMINKK